MTIRSGDRAVAAVRRAVPTDQEFAVLSAAMERGEVLRGCCRAGTSDGARDRPLGRA